MSEIENNPVKATLVARELGVSASYIRRELTVGRILGEKVGGVWFVLPDSYQQLLSKKGSKKTSKNQGDLSEDLRQALGLAVELNNKLAKLVLGGVKPSA